jgi:hypothetical protein
MKATESRITLNMIARSHKDQYDGVDFQRAAFDVEWLLDFELTDEERAQLESSPDPSCPCSFCKNADFRE